MPPKKKRKILVNGTAAKKQSKAGVEKTDDVKLSVGVLAYTHWLLKSEPNTRYENGIDMKFSFEDLKNCVDQTEHWDGVRNYQARNFLRDDIKEGHEAFFYHSNCKDPGIVGICKITRSGYIDHTQFEKTNPHYDNTSKRDNPKWYMVDVQYKALLDRFVPLSELKVLHQEHTTSGGSLRNMALFSRSRLSVQPVAQEEWDYIIELSKT